MEKCALSVRLNEEKNSLCVKWNDNHESRWHVKWIRHNCQCDRCFRRFPGHNPVDKATLDRKLILKSAELIGKEIHCVTERDIMQNHFIRLPLDFLLKYCNCNDCLKREISVRDVKNINPKEIETPRLKYAELVNDEGMFKCLQDILTYGFCIVEKFPIDSIDRLRNFAASIGPIRSTNYGDVWEVKNKPNPENVAYTAVNLPFHQDQPNYEMAPGVQFLVAARFDDSVKGGHSLLVDLLKIAEIFREQEPEHFRTLCRIPCFWDTIDFNRDEPVWYEHSKTHIEVDYFGKIVAVNWNPHLESYLRMREEDYEAYYAAYDAFTNLMNDEKYHFAFRLKPGDLEIFNNRRMGHSRTSYVADVPDSRTLWGCYIELDDLRCKYMTLARKLGIEVIPPKLGNGCSF